MKKLLFLIVAIVIVVGIIFLGFDGDKSTGKNDYKDIEIIPISHATAVLKWDDTVIYSDPVGGAEAFTSQPSPDIVFITHEHGDHFNIGTLQAVLKEKTTFVLPQAVADKLPEDFAHEFKVMKNDDEVTHGEFVITAVPSYNVREEALERHPEGRDNGYVIEHDGVRVYFSGDSEDTPDMRALKNIDLAFVAMNLPFTMGVEAAADAVLEFKPIKVYPYHYRTPEGFSDVAKFKELVNKGNSDIEVVQLDWYKAMTNQDAMKKEGDDKKMSEADVVIDISGKNFEFDIEEIKVSKGDTVKINFVSESGFHDWVVDEFDAATKRVRDGGKASVTFVADKAGKYEYYCSVGEHRARGMVGMLIVE